MFPFSLGLLAAGISPNGMGREAGVDPSVYALFLATAMSISALPVIAKTLMDITRTFQHEEIRQKAAEVRTYTEFLAMIRTQSKVRK